MVPLTALGLRLYGSLYLYILNNQKLVCETLHCLPFLCFMTHLYLVIYFCFCFRARPATDLWLQQVWTAGRWKL